MLQDNFSKGYYYLKKVKIPFENFYDLSVS